MARHRSEQQSDPTVAAMERVLKAERATEAKLRDCREQAAAIVAAARERTGGIARRAASPKELWILPEAGHIQAVRDKAVRARLAEFLTRQAAAPSSLALR